MNFTSDVPLVRLTGGATQSAQTGQNVNIGCDVSGFPTATDVYWEKYVKGTKEPNILLCPSMELSRNISKVQKN